MRIDIMTDIETLGHKTDSTIIQIASIAFDIETGRHFSRYNRIIDITKTDTLRVTGSTLKWWLNTDKDLLEQLINSGSISEYEALVEFHKWLSQQVENAGHRNVYLWGNGILFDNKMIQHQFEANGLDYPIFYRNDRDVRTIVELASKKLGMSEKELKQEYADSSLVAHNAFDDVISQIILVSGCYSILL